MNRRNFLKMAGMGSAIAMAPILAKVGIDLDSKHPFTEEDLRYIRNLLLMQSEIGVRI